MEVWEVEGIVLKKVDFGEADRLITLLTEEKGKVIGTVKGIRKSKNRESFASEPLVLGSYKINKKLNSAIINKLNVEKPYLSIRKKYIKIQIATYLLKFVDMIAFENIESKKLYKLLENSLDYLEKSEDEKTMLVMLSYFVYKVIVYEGLSVEVEGEKYFDFSTGKITDKNSIDAIELKTYTSKYLKLLITVDIDGINKLQSNNKNIVDVIRVLERYINFNLHLNLKIYTYLGEEII